MADMKDLRVKIKGDSSSFRGAADAAKSSSRSMTSAFKQAKNQTDDLSDGLSSAARAQGVYVDAAGKAREANGRLVTSARKAELGIKSLGKGSKKTSASFKTMATNAKKLVSPLSIAGSGLKSFASLAAGATVAATAFAGAIIFKSSSIRNMARWAEVLGVTTKAMQEWTFAGSRLGLDADKISDIFKDVSDKIGDFLATGGGEAKDIFEQLSLNAKDFKDLSPDQILLKLGAALDSVGKKEQIFFMEALANDAALLLPLIQQNGAAFKSLADEAAASGSVLSEDQIKRVTQFNESIKKIQGSIGGFYTQLTAALAAPFTILSDELNNVIGAFGGPTVAAQKFAAFLINGVASMVDAVGRLTMSLDDLSIKWDELVIKAATFAQYNPFSKLVNLATGQDPALEIQSRQQSIAETRANSNRTQAMGDSIRAIAKTLVDSIDSSITSKAVSGSSKFDQLIERISQSGGVGSIESSISWAQLLINETKVGNAAQQQQAAMMQQTLDRAIQQQDKEFKSAGKLDIRLSSGSDEITGELKGDPEFLKLFKQLFENNAKQAARSVAQ